MNGGGTEVACTATVVNYLTGAGGLSATPPSTLSMTRCVGGSGPINTLTCTTVTTTLTQPLTTIQQCNGSGNGGGGAVVCTVLITNHFVGSPGPLTPATVYQCVGSVITGPGAPAICTPVNTPGISVIAKATVGQCNGSGNGGTSVGFICTVATGSTMPASLPVNVDQCNGSGNGGGALVTCLATVVNDVIPQGTMSTQAAAGSVAVNSPISDAVVIAGNPPPSGSVAFLVCGPAVANPDCSVGGAPVGMPKALSGGAAVSDPYIPTLPGNYCFRVVYSGDASYPGATATNQTTSNGANNAGECFSAISQSQAVITTQAAAGALLLSGVVADTATVSGNPAPTGTVSFFVCGPATVNPSCAAGGVQVGGTKTLVGGSAVSDPYTPMQQGSYCFRALYSGDQNHPASTATNQTTSNGGNNGGECFTAGIGLPPFVPTPGGPEIPPYIPPYIPPEVPAGATPTATVPATASPTATPTGTAATATPTQRPPTTTPAPPTATPTLTRVPGTPSPAAHPPPPLPPRTGGGGAHPLRATSIWALVILIAAVVALVLASRVQRAR